MFDPVRDNWSSEATATVDTLLCAFVAGKSLEGATPSDNVIIGDRHLKGNGLRSLSSTPLILLALTYLESR